MPAGTIPPGQDGGSIRFPIVNGSRPIEQSLEPARSIRALEELSIALVLARDLRDMIECASEAFTRCLGPDYSCSILLTDDDALADDGPHDGRGVSIPLFYEDQLLGTMLFDGPAHRTSAALSNLPLDSMTRIIGAAIAGQEELSGEQTKRLKEASQLRFDAVSMLSHEMRTPLATIKGYASALLLDDVDWDETQRVEFLQNIEDEADHLTALVSEVLESAALESGELRIDASNVHIPVLARRVAEKLSIQTDNHRIVLSFPPTFPVVSADEGQIEQVLRNLVDNAIKYSPDGGLIVIRGELRPDEVIVSVIDQGMGITPEDLNMLFERFFRASPNRRDRIGGTGLGLPIADSIIRTHGGRIWAESTLGQGTSLAFALPRQSTTELRGADSL